MIFPRRSTLFATIVATSFFLCGTVIVARQRRSSLNSSPRTIHSIKDTNRLVPPVPSPPIFAVKVHMSTKGELRVFHERLAKQMSQTPLLPTQRIQYFSWLQDNYRVDGWHATIRSTELVQAGTLVTLQVAPVLERPLGTGDSIFETYLVMIDGTIQFIRSEAPPWGRDQIIHYH